MGWGRGKYNNQKTTVLGITFDSRKEALYYLSLMSEKKRGKIKAIELQVPFELQEGFRKGGKKYRPITYVADFVITYKDGKKAIVDVKGVKTEVFKLKQKMFEYKYPHLTIELV